MKLNINCPVNTTSYGYVSSHFMLELDRLGCELKHIPISTNSPDANLANRIAHLTNQQDFHHHSACIKIWHQHGLFPSYGKGPFFGFPIFELNKFNETEKFSLSYPDHLIVPSHWAKDIILSTFPDREDSVHVVPLGYDPDIFTPVDLPEREVTVFGNFGKWELRKGHDILAKAFHKAFQNEKDVLLVMMPTNMFLNQQESNQWISKYLPLLDGKVQFINRLPTQDLMFHVMKDVHCGVFPSRAEGWNLEALELLAMGRYLIITDCTGHTEFCNKYNSALIDMGDQMEVAFDNKFFDGRGEWHSFSDDQMDQLVEYLRKIHKARKEGLLGKQNALGASTASEFTWKKSAKKLYDVINKFGV